MSRYEYSLKIGHHGDKNSTAFKLVDYQQVEILAKPPTKEERKLYQDGKVEVVDDKFLYYPAGSDRPIPPPRSIKVKKEPKNEPKDEEEESQEEIEKKRLQEINALMQQSQDILNRIVELEKDLETKRDELKTHEQTELEKQLFRLDAEIKKLKGVLTIRFLHFGEIANIELEQNNAADIENAIKEKLPNDPYKLIYKNERYDTVDELFGGHETHNFDEDYKKRQHGILFVVKPIKSEK